VTFSVVQRRPILGTLRALGVTRGQIFSMILWEAALLGAVGMVFGLALGVIMGRAAVAVVTQTVSSLYFTVTVQSVDVPPMSLVKGALIGIGAALLAALMPAFEATTTPPVGALRRSDIERKVRRAIPAVTLIGLVVVAASFLALAFNNLPLSFAGLFGIVVGFSLLTPLVALILMSAIRPLSGAILGVLGLMAPRSIIRSLSRTSVAVAALMVAVSVIVGVSAMVGSFRNDVEDWLTNTIRADILISPPSIAANRQDVPVDPAMAETIRRTPGIARVGIVRRAIVYRPGDPLPVNLDAIDIDISEGHRRFVWSNGGYDAVWQQMGQGGVIVSEPFARRRGIPIGPGQSVRLITDRGEREFPIAGVIYDYTSDQGVILMRDPIYRAVYDDTAISNAAAFVAPGADLGPIASLREQFGKQE
jgi:putative ABC transport system permease protein